jgi:hypothetical protein
VTLSLRIHVHHDESWRSRQPANIRGLARVVNALHERDFEYATDVAKRFAWPRTRAVLLAAIYATAELSGERKAMVMVASIANFSQTGE